MREVALRFGYLRRVVLAELTRVLAEHDMTPPAYHVLFRLATEGGELPQQELVLDVDLDAAGVSRLLSRMVDQGYLTTKVDPEDRRRRIVQLTEEGRRLHDALSPEVDAAARRVAGGLTHEEELQLLDLLDKAVTATRELHARKR
jgi:DNA-binding MarR family transcriptional regulator